MRPSLLCFLFAVVVISVMFPSVSGFQSPASLLEFKTNTDTRLNAAIVDPSDFSAILAAAQHGADLPIPSALSAILTTTIDFATGATSIHPAIQAATSTSPETIQQLLPAAGDAVQAQAQQALTSGWKVLDATKFVHSGGAILPGFSETKSALAPHVIPYPMSGSITPSNFPQYEVGDRMSASYLLLQSFQKLPYIALAYAVVEFFFLRSDVDLYKEDVEDDPSGVLAETVSDTGVRVALFFVVALITYAIL